MLDEGSLNEWYVWYNSAWWYKGKASSWNVTLARLINSNVLASNWITIFCPCSKVQMILFWWIFNGPSRLYEFASPQFAHPLGGLVCYRWCAYRWLNGCLYGAVVCSCTSNKIPASKTDSKYKTRAKTEWYLWGYARWIEPSINITCIEIHSLLVSWYILTALLLGMPGVGKIFFNQIQIFVPPYAIILLSSSQLVIDS